MKSSQIEEREHQEEEATLVEEEDTWFDPPVSLDPSEPDNEVYNLNALFVSVFKTDLQVRYPMC